MSKSRAKKARKSNKSQDVSAPMPDLYSSNAAAPQQRPQPIPPALMTEDQQRLQYLHLIAPQYQTHLVALTQQQSETHFLHNLSLAQGGAFINALASQQLTPEYLADFATHQRLEFLTALSKMHYYRQHLFALQSMGQEEIAQYVRVLNNTTAHCQPSAQPTQQEPVVPSIDTRSADPFHRIGEDVQEHVLSYLMCLKDGQAERPKVPSQFFIETHIEEDKALHPGSSYSKLAAQFHSLSDKEKEKYKALAEQDKDRYLKEDAAFTRPADLILLCKTLSLVSKDWRGIVGSMMNSQAPLEIISARGLFALKTRARTLALSTISKSFLKEIKETWGKQSLSMYGGPDSGSALDICIRHFANSEEDFCKLVANEYARFLVVKSVETMASLKDFDQVFPTVQIWREKCQPTKLLDMFWHAHMCDPRKYAIDCHILITDLVSSNADFSIGSIIGHDAGYVSSNEFAGSDYSSKRDILFQFEGQFAELWGSFSERIATQGTRENMLFPDNFTFRGLATEIWQDITSYNDCG